MRNDAEQELIQFVNSPVVANILAWLEAHVPKLVDHPGLTISQTTASAELLTASPDLRDGYSGGLQDPRHHERISTYHEVYFLVSGTDIAAWVGASSPTEKDRDLRTVGDLLKDPQQPVSMIVKVGVTDWCNSADSSSYCGCSDRPEFQNSNSDRDICIVGYLPPENGFASLSGAPLAS